MTSSGLTRKILPFLLACLVGAAGLAPPASAQPVRAGDTFYLKFGVGLSDYAGDNSGPDFGANRLPNAPDPLTGIEDLFDTRKFSEGGPFPYALTGEVGYQFTPTLGVGLGYQFGQYPFTSGVPFTIDENPIGQGGDLGTVRHTIQLLGRYMFGAKEWTFSPYLDAGLNLSLGGYTAGIGPLAGLGLDVSLSDRTSLFLETRINVVFGDEAVDGINTGGESDALSALPSLGLKYTFERPAVAPRVIALDAPAEVQVGESVTFTARVNEAEATRPLTYQWTFGDGHTGSGLTSSHTYNQPGTYDVTFTARNDAGTARDSLSVEVLPLRPARILSVNATPNPATEGELVRFESEVEGTSPVSLEWNFGDGETGVGASSTHTYDEPGRYTVHLVASNEDGEERDSLTMRVERVLPAICKTIREFNPVYFDYGSNQISSSAEKKLQENTDVLLKCPNLSVRVEGFASPDEPNAQALSEARARTVTDFYKEEGVDPDRIQASGEEVVEGAMGKKGDAQQSRRVDTIPLDDDSGAQQEN